MVNNNNMKYKYKPSEIKYKNKIKIRNAYIKLLKYIRVSDYKSEIIQKYIKNAIKGLQDYEISNDKFK